VKHGLRSRSRIHRHDDSDLQSALEAMSVEELRAFARDALERLDAAPRGELVNCLIARAAKGSSGWRPSGPSRRIVDEVKGFVIAARRFGQADPQEVDTYLRAGTRALLAGNHALAREVFEALLPPVMDGEINLGQDELVDEVLTVDGYQCAAQYIASVYTTTALEERAEALCRAIGAVEGLASLWEPLGAMENAVGKPLPELDDFLTRWVAFLEQRPGSLAR